MRGKKRGKPEMTGGQRCQEARDARGVTEGRGQGNQDNRIIDSARRGEDSGSAGAFSADEGNQFRTQRQRLCELWSTICNP